LNPKKDTSNRLLKTEDLLKLLNSVCEQWNSEYPETVLQAIAEFAASSFFFRDDDIGNGPYLELSNGNMTVKCMNPNHTACLQLLDVEIDSTEYGSWRWQYHLDHYRGGAHVCMGLVLKPESNQELFGMGRYALNEHYSRERWEPHQYKTVSIYDHHVSFSSSLSGCNVASKAKGGICKPQAGDRILFAMEQNSFGSEKPSKIKLFVFHVTNDGRLNHVIQSGTIAAEGIYIPALTFYQKDGVTIETFGENVQKSSMDDITTFIKNYEYAGFSVTYT